LKKGAELSHVEREELNGGIWNIKFVTLTILLFFVGIPLLGLEMQLFVIISNCRSDEHITQRLALKSKNLGSEQLTHCLPIEKGDY